MLKFQANIYLTSVVKNLAFMGVQVFRVLWCTQTDILSSKYLYMLQQLFSICH